MAQTNRTNPHSDNSPTATRRSGRNTNTGNAVPNTSAARGKRQKKTGSKGGQRKSPPEVITFFAEATVDPAQCKAPPELLANEAHNPVVAAVPAFPAQQVPLLPLGSYGYNPNGISVPALPQQQLPILPLGLMPQLVEGGASAANPADSNEVAITRVEHERPCYPVRLNRGALNTPPQEELCS